MLKQAEAIARARGKEAFAFLMEMGTGKSKVFIDEAATMYCDGDVQDVIVCCPNGLQRNWLDEYMKHCGVPYAAAFFEGKMKAAERRNVEQLLKLRDPRILRVLVTSFEALRGDAGFEAAYEFADQGRKLYVGLDEAQRIKATARRAVQRDSVLALGRNADVKRIGSGTITPNSPVDLWSPFKFLGEHILGFSTLTAFRAHHCELLAPDNKMLRGLAVKMFGNPARARYMQVQARDQEGRPLYKNLGELNKRIAPHSFRARKDECLDLPPKVYAPRVTYELSPKQRKIYDEIKNNIIAEFVHKGKLYTVDSQLQISKLQRLAAVVGNHFPDEKRNAVRIEPSKHNPRMQAVTSWLENGGDVSSIIWARHTAEVDELCEVYKGECVRYDGAVDNATRQKHKVMFMAGERRARKLIGQVSLGIGFDGYIASLVAFYSNDFSLEHRLQSEDRAHRKGLDHSVTYGDFEALNTYDARVIKALRDKREISEIIAGDPITNWI